MTHRIIDTSQDFDAKKYFTKARRHYIEEPLKALGFKKYKTSVIARLTTDNVFQFLDFQKSWYGGQNFTINACIRPLFSRNYEYLTLRPGNRLGSMSEKLKSDIWWNYSTQEQGDKSFSEIIDIILETAIPFFDATKTSKEIISSYEKDSLEKTKLGERVQWGTMGWKDFDFGHIYLQAGQIENAIKHFNSCYEIFGKDDRDWAQDAAKECLEIKHIIELGQPEIDNYLADTINDSKQKLKLVAW